MQASKQLSDAEAADDLIGVLQQGHYDDPPLDLSRVSGPDTHTWLVALADLAALKGWLAAECDPIELVAGESPARELLTRYLLSYDQAESLATAPAWSQLCWVDVFSRHLDELILRSGAQGQWSMPQAEVMMLVDHAALSVRLHHLFPNPVDRPGDLEYRLLFHQVYPLLEAHPDQVVTVLRAFRDMAQSLLDQLEAPPVAGYIADQ